jgi:hypothetical protein
MDRGIFLHPFSGFSFPTGVAYPHRCSPIIPGSLLHMDFPPDTTELTELSCMYRILHFRPFIPLA